jgi:hypothetical protein
MNAFRRLVPMLMIGVFVLLPAALTGQEEALPPGLTKEQRSNLLAFLKNHARPDRYVPADAKVINTQPDSPDLKVESKPSDKPVKQYMVQIISHRPVPDQEDVKQVDVVYYRPNPEKGKPGITVMHTVDVTTGKEVGQTQVFLNQHTPLSRDELAEAVALAHEKSQAVIDLYKDRDKSTVHWEYLQMKINRKHEAHEPGDRVVRLVFTAAVRPDEAPPTPVRVIVNLTNGLVATDPR